MTDYKLVPVDLLSELAESLAAELDARYPASVRSYESQDRKYQAEMEPVLTARQIIAAAPAVQGDPVAHLRRDQLQQIKTRGPVVGEISPSPRGDMVAVYAAPDVSALVEALERISNMDSMSYHSLDSEKIVARNALSAYRKQGGEA